MSWLQFFSLLVAPTAALAGIWLTNKHNLKQLKGQHDYQVAQQKAHREYEIKKEMYQAVITEIVKIQQLLGLTLYGELSDEECRERSKACGLAAASITLVANPATLRLVQKYMLRCTRAVLAGKLWNDMIVSQKAHIAEQPPGAGKESLELEMHQHLLSRFDRNADEMAALVTESVPVLLAIRSELTIDTSRQEFAVVVQENANDGKAMLKEIADNLRNLMANRATQ